MSAYENVIGGKLKLKGKALDVKAGGVKKKKKHKKKQQQEEDLISQQEDQPSAGGESGGDIDVVGGNKNDEEQGIKEGGGGGGGGGGLEDVDDLLTPAERRYIDQRERIDVKRLAKTANKSHRDRIQDFNQYLANMSEHYDIPKVGPG